jgi:putative transposase
MVWNTCVNRSRDLYLFEDKTSISHKELSRELTDWRQTYDWLKQGSSVVQQQVIQDFQKSRDAFFGNLKKKVKRKVGLPRFKKKRSTLPSLNYTGNAFQLKNLNNSLYLVLVGNIVVSVVWSRDLPSKPSSVRVYRNASGEWYASFVVEKDYEPLPHTGIEIGVDWGVKTVASTVFSDDTNIYDTNDFDLESSRKLKTAQSRLKRFQRKQSRLAPDWKKKEKPSSAYEKVKVQTAKLHAKVARQRKDEQTKWQKKIVDNCDMLMVEDFKPSFMSKNKRLAATVADNAVGAAKRGLIERANRYGRLVVLVDPKNTTQKCSKCDTIAKIKLELSCRVYDCVVCGHVQDRDKNAATNVLRQGRAVLVNYTQCKSGVF